MPLKRLVQRRVEPPEKMAGEFTQEWAAALGDNLVSVVLTGGAVSGDFKPGRSLLRMLVVVHRLDPPILDRLAPLVERWEEMGAAPPRVLTPAEVPAGARALALKFLDILENHRVLRGTDPFEGLEVQRADVRYHLEAEVHTELLRLRDLYMESSPRPRDLEEPLADMVDILGPIARGLLYLQGKSGPLSRRELFTGAAREYPLSMSGFERALAIRDGRIQEKELPMALRDLIGLLERIQQVVSELPR